MDSRKSVGPRIEPCGTPALTEYSDTLVGLLNSFEINCKNNFDSFLNNNITYIKTNIRRTYGVTASQFTWKELCHTLIYIYL